MDIIEKKHIIKKHNHSRNDPYFWLSDKKNKSVQKVIQQCNQFTENHLQDTKQLQEKLYHECKSKLIETHKTKPTKFIHYYYFHEIKKNQSYGKYYIQKTLQDKPFSFLNLESLSKGKKHFELKHYDISYDETKVIFSLNFKGNNENFLYSKDLFSNHYKQELSFPVDQIIYFHKNNNSCFYLRYDKNQRPFQVWYHTLHDNEKNDKLLFTEKDDLYWIELNKSSDNNYIIINCVSYNSSYNLIIDEEIQIKQMTHKKNKLNSYINHYHNDFYILSNENKKINFHLKNSKKELLSYNHNRYIESFGFFNDYIYIFCRESSFPKLIIINLVTNKKSYITFPDKFFTIEFPKIYNLSNKQHLYISYSTFSKSERIYQLNDSDLKLI